jgi:photosystem II stability/assembly factor-like uncharacterized protein
MAEAAKTLLVGTGKGAFILRSDGGKGWTMDGPHFAGRSVYAMMLDTRKDRNRIWAAATSWHFGAELVFSDDGGKTWDMPEEMRIKMPEDTEKSLENIWQIAPGADDDTIYVGVAPAALFESHDNGATWSLNRGLWNHPHREQWQPGFGGLCLHTIVADADDPKKLKIAISTGGVYQSEDGGQTWRVTNKGVSAYFMPDKYPEFGQCVHKIAVHPTNKDTLFLQNHHGVYRSRDGGNNWEEIENGLPSNFGFPIAATANGSVFIIPLQKDAERFTCEGKLRVYRSRDEGDTWEALTKGLPQENAYEVILRDAMCAAGYEVYFGTKNGKLFGTRDNGDSWEMIQGSLPEINCVRAY